MKKVKSTSIHSLNADDGLGFFAKFGYLFLNWVNNLYPYANLDQRIKFKSFGDNDWRKEWDKTYQTSSVGRRLSDLFWRTLPWDKIREELGEIHIFDTGCGSGNYGARLDDASGGVASYTGIDAKEKPNWAELQAKYPNFKLIKSLSTNIRPLIPTNTNFFITQSAIEHFDEDLAFFEQIRDFIAETNKPIIQVHIFPARATLPLYIFHGLRQYTPRTISKITQIFSGDHNFYLYGLGGKVAKKVQWHYFTWPLLILRKQAIWSEDIPKYDREVRRAIEYDIANPSPSPLFWALIIHSLPKMEIW